MKARTVATVLTCLLLAGNVYAGRHFTPDFHDAPGLATATTGQDRPILLLFTAPWCTACEGVKRNILADSSAETVLRQFTTVEINIEQSAAEESLAETWNVSALPTLVVLHPDGASSRYDGRLERKPLLRWLESQAIVKGPR
ncbi:MAG: hypothetical protein D6761_11355 [Candidatus Dadabacteria bacterium]|nr:MAG: hypothetical protein D6761_11355 [Candidatus Dadabacteria bacterium]